MYRRILAPVDGSVTAQAGLREAIRLARDQNAVLRVLHIVDQKVLLSAAGGAWAIGAIMQSMRQEGERIMSEAVVAARAEGITPETSIMENFNGRVHQLILEEARTWHADLIVMGTHGRRGVDHLLMGSDAEGVIRVSPVPVLLVRAQEGTAATKAPATATKHDPAHAGQ
jgi:nucleotide-binding universal stress UspA family protein